MVTKRGHMPTDRNEDSVRNQLNAPFKFMVRPFTTVGVESLELASLFEDEILEGIFDTKFESKITAIIVFGFPTWLSSSRQEKLNIMSDNIRNSFQKIPSTYLADADRDKLILALDQAHKRLIPRVSH